MIKVGDRVQWIWDGTPKDAVRIGRFVQRGEVIDTGRDANYHYRIRTSDSTEILAKASEVTLLDPLELLAELQCPRTTK